MLKILVKKIIFNFFYICPKFVAFTLSIFTYIFFIKNLKKNTNYKLNFLVLNHKRFNQDLNILAEDNNFSFFTINEKFLYYLISPYVYLIKNDLKKNKWWQIQSKNNYIKFLKDGSNFIHFFLKYLYKFKKIDFIITPTYYYFQDRLFEEAINNTKIKYIVINKENLLDTNNFNSKVQNNIKKNISFKGSYIITQNDLENNCLVKSNIANTKKIITLGSPRFDKFYFDSKRSNFNQNNNNFTLFSFRHSIGGFKLIDQNNTSGFSNYLNDGAQNYFKSVHSSVMQCAYLNKKSNFYIKTKFKKGWIDRINEIKTYYQLFYKDDLSNVIITDEIPAQDLIKKSKIIAGINSSALIEARVLGRKVLIPIFDEVSKKMNDYVYFKKYFKSEFIVCNNSNNFISSINSLLAEKFSYNRINDLNLLDETFSFDKDGYDRYSKFFLKIN